MWDIFYIAHLGVRYEIYPAHFPFDLRCQSGILFFNGNCRQGTAVNFTSPDIMCHF